MSMQFSKANKSQSKLRAAIFGPSGAGKTFTALRIATGMGGKIAVIDTERGSASKYADRFEFDVLDLPDNDINTYVQAIKTAGVCGYDVLVIDSLSHGWKELLKEIDSIAKAKYKGNTWAAWSDGTPKQQSLVNAILDYPGHVVASMRSKTEWTTEKDDRTGRSRPVRIGLAPEEGKGIEYEFDLLLEMSTEHLATVIKDRTGKFQDQIIDKPGEDFGKQLVDWLSESEPVPPNYHTLAIQAIRQWSGLGDDDLRMAAKDTAIAAGTKDPEQILSYVNEHNKSDFFSHISNAKQTEKTQ